MPQAELPHRALGASTLSVSRIALGSWRTFERMERGDAEGVLGHALDRGIDFLDDARYDDETGLAPLATGYMGFERLDLLYSSTLPDDLPVAVAVEQIAGVLATGRVSAWGVVNWSAAALAEAGREAQRQSIPPPCAVQLPYSLVRLDWVQDPAMEAALQSTGASLIPSATLAGGALSGKYGHGGAGRLSGELQAPRWRQALELGDALRQLAERLQTTPATLAISFTLLHPRTAATLIGATHPEQIDAAVEAVGVAGRLSATDVAELRALSTQPA